MAVDKQGAAGRQEAERSPWEEVAGRQGATGSPLAAVGSLEAGRNQLVRPWVACLGEPFLASSEAWLLVTELLPAKGIS